MHFIMKYTIIIPITFLCSGGKGSFYSKQQQCGMWSCNAFSLTMNIDNHNSRRPSSDAMMTHTQNTNDNMIQDPFRRSFFVHAQTTIFVGSIIAATVGSSSIPSSAAFAVETMDEPQKDPRSQPQEDRQPRGGGKPYAPMEALLPATRLKLWVDEAFEITSLLATTATNSINSSSSTGATNTNTNQKEEESHSNSNHKSSIDLVHQLNDVLQNPPPLFVESSSSSTNFPNKRGTASASGSTAQLTTGISSINKVQYQQNRKNLSSWGDRVTAMLNQADVERQWGMLQYQESKLESQDPLRAAFNTYTSQLVFGDSYLLTAPSPTKKRMIRQEELPTLASVVTSDLDLRDLYRNQFLTSMEDLKAEVVYQLKTTRTNDAALNIDEIVDLMTYTHNACASWFTLIPLQDVQDAITYVQNEKVQS